MSVALNVCFRCNLGSQSQKSSVRRKTCHGPNTATLQHVSSIRMNRATVRSTICWLPPNRTNGVAVFEGRPVRYNTL